MKKTTKAAAAKKVAARKPEKARPAEEKQNKTAEEKPTVRSETARKIADSLIRHRTAKKKETKKTKPSRPIAFTLDEAIEVAESKKNTPETKSKPDEKKKKTAPAAKKTAPVEEPKQENRVLGAASVADILGYNPATGPRPAANEEIPPKFQHYYKLLLELRDHVKSGLDMRTKETLKRSSKEDSGNLSAYSQHMADIGTDTFDRDFALSLVSSEQDALYEIEDAIRRIKRGTYGICEITGKPINKERLLAVPFAKYSIEGQVEYEKTNRRKARSGALGENAGEGLRFMETESDDD